MNTTDPFHDGERTVQERAGVRAEALEVGRIVGDRIPAGALGFVGRQTMAIAGSVSPVGEVWASLLLGPPGFLVPQRDRALEIDLAAAAIHPADPLRSHLEADPRIGVLLIELATRRRLRINGRATLAPSGRLRIEVAEAYPNCPRFIRKRTAVVGDPATEGSGDPGAAQRGIALGPDERALIAAADTLFVASAHPRGGVDASHRGGAPGFVEVVGARTLRVPDYAGNNMFNTLGNFLADPRAGLLFVDFAGRRTLQLVGRAEVVWPEDAGDDSDGASRAWLFAVDGWLLAPLPPGFGWETLDP